MFSLRRFWQRGRLRSARFVLVLALGASFVLFQGSVARAAVSSSGNVVPVPPAAGGAFAGPFEIGDVDVGTMNINTSGGASPISHTGAAILGDIVTGIGIANLSGFGSDWTLTSSTTGDMVVGNNGTGSLNLSNLAFVSVNDDLFVGFQPTAFGEISISGLGTIVDVGDDAIIGDIGQAVVEIFNGGRLVSDANIIGDEAAGDGRVTLSDPFSLWRTTNTLIVGDAGRGLLQIFDGARVEDTGGSVAQQPGSTGTVEVDGPGSRWQNSLNLTIGASGHGTLLVRGGGRVVNGLLMNSFIIGREVGSVGEVEVRGLDSHIEVSLMDVGDLGTGTLHILEGGRVTSGQSILGDNATSRGVVVVDGNGSRWDASGAVAVAEFGEAHLTVSNGGVVHTSSVARVAALGRITLDDGRLEIENMPLGLSNFGVIDGNGTIEVSTTTNNASGRIRPGGPEPLLFTGTLNNSGTVDVQSGILEVTGPTINNLDIDARDGAILRFRGSGLDNNSGAQLAITSGVVDVFGLVTNDFGGEIAVGGTAVAVFHDAVSNAGTIFVQPGGEIFMLENLGFTPSAALGVGLQAIDETDPDTEPSDAFGQVQVSGAASLAGTLEVSLLEGYMPMAGDSFQILTAAGGRTGTFSNEVLPSLSSGLDWDLAYNPNSVVLSVISTGLPGDYNGDGRVDAADYVVWRKTDGSQAGYDLWRMNFGRTAGSGASTSAGVSAAVPEPAAILMVLAASLAGLYRRRVR